MKNKTANGMLTFSQIFTLTYMVTFTEINKAGEEIKKERKQTDQIEIHGELAKHFGSYRTKCWAPNLSLTDKQKELLNLTEHTKTTRNHNDQYLLDHSQQPEITFLDALKHLQEWCSNNLISTVPEESPEETGNQELSAGTA